jgi:hypothetical protein
MRRCGVRRNTQDYQQAQGQNRPHRICSIHSHSRDPKPRRHHDRSTQREYTGMTIAAVAARTCAGLKTVWLGPAFRFVRCDERSRARCIHMTGLRECPSGGEKSEDLRDAHHKGSEMRRRFLPDSPRYYSFIHTVETGYFSPRNRPFSSPPCAQRGAALLPRPPQGQPPRRSIEPFPKSRHSLTLGI